MKKQLAKLALTAAIGLALTLLACEDKEKKQTPAETQTAEPAAPEPTEAEKARDIAEALAKAKAEVAAKGSFTDTRDNKTYKAVKIGEQVWMAENLNYAAEGSECYGNDPDNCESRGYNLETAMKVCPSGWHLPTEDEAELLLHSGSEEELTEKMKPINAESWWISGVYDNWGAVFHIYEECGEDVCTHIGGTLKKFELSIRCIKD